MRVGLRFRRRRWIVRFSTTATLLVAPGAALADPTFEMISPIPQTYVWGVGPGGDFTQLPDSVPGGAADVTAQLRAVGTFNFPGISSSGCSPVDFVGFAAGSIALMQRGSCNFSLKAQNAFNAGAVGALIFNHGVAGNTGSFEGALGVEGATPMPTFLVSYTLGSYLSSFPSGSVTLRMVTTANSSTAPILGSAVPEPSTWAMMLIGFGAVGFSIRRSRCEQDKAIKAAA